MTLMCPKSCRQQGKCYIAVMKKLIESLEGYIILTLLWALERVPSAWLQSILAALFRGFYFCSPHYRGIADTNLAIVFPNLSLEERNKIRSQSCDSLARTIVDLLRAPKLDTKWMREHVSFPMADKLRAYSQSSPPRPILLVSGHLGSFELLSHFTSTFIAPFGVVVREFRHPAVQRWWSKRRELTGNNVISRSGGLKTIVRQLKSGRNVGVLFDQNVTRNNAVFVPWFGLEAATTAALGFAVTQVRPIVVMISMLYQGNDRYVVDCEEINFDAILDDPTLDRNDRIVKITASLVRKFEERLRRDPAGWFWLHRRWKTRPEGQPENIYKRRVA